MLHLYYVFYILNFNFFCSWYLSVYYAIFCPTLNKDVNNNNNNNNNNNKQGVWAMY